MHVEVDGTRLFFDVEGPGLVPDGRELAARPTVVLVHGGPGTWDHSYLKPDFGRLARHAQVVYVDLPGHGRSDWGDHASWSLEGCADSLAAFCEALGIERPVVLGHSLGVPVALLFGARNPGRAGALVLVGGFARFDIPRLVEAFRRLAGDEIAELARRTYTGEGVTEEQWARVFAAFGAVPDEEQLARRRQNLELNKRGLELMRQVDIRAELGHVDCRTLVCVGERDPVTPLEAAEEIVAGLPAGLGELVVVAGAGHFPWRDGGEAFWVPVERLLQDL